MVGYQYEGFACEDDYLDYLAEQDRKFEEACDRADERYEERMLRED